MSPICCTTAGSTLSTESWPVWLYAGPSSAAKLMPGSPASSNGRKSLRISLRRDSSYMSDEV